ncbi:MAG: ATP-binding protein [Stagnimonas sp.]|nr:ATP-binding protein [Stagnimonas sp.]
MSDALRFAEEPEPTPSPARPWPVLVVDDDAEVLAVTRLALQDCLVEGRPLELLEASSGRAARAVLEARGDIGLILLDVVMESEHAGLELVQHVREVLGNSLVRIVLRTGQPGEAPAREVLQRYQIDDYRTKTELNFERLVVLVTAALRTYGALTELARKNIELKRSNQELERFAYVASHDLQTPLRGIVSFTHLLAQRYQHLFDAQAREYMDFIVHGGHELQRLIDDLLAFSRLGRGDGELSPVDLQQVFGHVLGTLEPVIAQRQARIEAEPLPVVLGRAQQLEQLFRNLIDNGLKFQPGERPWVRIRSTCKDRHCELAFEDGGIGIAAEHQAQIFEVFTRLHTQDAYPGSGVGLAICRKIALLHGAELQVESAPGQGTRMILGPLALAG